jgi:anti-sigma28 factor (negative regulator of flagellin synthesis)
MIDDIKGQGIPAVLYAADTKDNNTKPISKDALTEGVMVTNQLKGLLNIVKQDVSFSTEEARVATVKASVQSGQYRVDLYALSDKLLDNQLLMAND